jgi:hypothetical protein
MANGLHLVDQRWIQDATHGEIYGVPVRVAAPEELIFHRLFIWERHRSDMSDIAHLILMYGAKMDWDRLIRRLGEHWRLLLSQMHFFDFVYPGRPECIPRPVRERLLSRAQRAMDEPPPGPSDVCQGTLISRFSFAIDVHEWGFKDPRAESVEAARSLPIVTELEADPVWDSVEKL